MKTNTTTHRKLLFCKFQGEEENRSMLNFLKIFYSSFIYNHSIQKWREKTYCCQISN